MRIVNSLEKLDIYRKSGLPASAIGEQFSDKVLVVEQTVRCLGMERQPSFLLEMVIQCGVDVASQWY